MAKNFDPLDFTKLTPVSGFVPYFDGPNFRAVSEADGSNRLFPAVAVDYENMSSAFKRDRGVGLQFAEGYRPDYVGQWRWDEHLAGGPLAAPVGTSNHRDGTTLDLRNGIGYGPSNENYQWMAANGEKYGFYRDTVEFWHWHHPQLVALTGTISGAGTGAEEIIESKDGLMYLVWNYAKSAGYLFTANGQYAFSKKIGGFSGGQQYALMKRLINSKQDQQFPERFTAAELSTIRAILKAAK